VADWLVLVGAVALFVSLFLTWSHQLPVRGGLAGSPAISDVPPDPTAWQVYSVADLLLVLLALVLVAVARRGRSLPARATTLGAVGVALTFVVHAAGHAPTDGVYLPSLGSYGTAASGGGETVAIVALCLAAAGLLLSLVFDLSSNRVRHPHR
jgi:hypothetical protein